MNEEEGKVAEFWSAGGRMKVDEAVQEWLVENLTDWLDSLHDSMKNWINKIREAGTVEDIMRHKKGMILEYLDSMPIGINECYFCLLHNADECEEAPCEYGAIHGFCNNNDSDYEEIRKLREKLRTAVEERYYRGESYDVSDMEGV